MLTVMKKIEKLNEVVINIFSYKTGRKGENFEILPENISEYNYVRDIKVNDLPYLNNMEHGHT